MKVYFRNIPVDVEVFGEGPTLVLLHGFLENKQIWKPFIELFTEKYKVVCIDLLGHGETPGLGDMQTMEIQADLVAEVLEELNINIARFIGHSMGGYITMAFAEKYPKKVKSLMLLNSSPKADSKERLKERDQVIKIVRKHQEIFIKSAIKNQFGEESQEKFEEELNWFIEQGLQLEVEDIVNSLKGMKNRKDREDVLKKFKGTKWMVIAKDDALISHDVLAEIAESTQSILLSLPGGHMSYIEQKEKTIEAFKGFLKL